MRTVKMSEGERLSLHRLLAWLLSDRAKTGAIIPHKSRPIWERVAYPNKGDLANLNTLRGKVE